MRDGVRWLNQLDDRELNSKTQTDTKKSQEEYMKLKKNSPPEVKCQSP